MQVSTVFKGLLKPSIAMCCAIVSRSKIYSYKSAWDHEGKGAVWYSRGTFFVFVLIWDSLYWRLDLKRGSGVSLPENFKNAIIMCFGAF